MKKLGLLMLLASLGLMVAAAASAEDAYMYIPPTAGWVSTPLIPFDADPLSVFFDYDEGWGIAYNLLRLDAPNQREVLYAGDPDYPDLTWGGALLGDGLIVGGNNVGTVTVSYDGVPESYLSDVWISLPGNQKDPYVEPPLGGGLHWVGCPFNHQVSVDNVLVTDGRETVDIFTACYDRGWLTDLWLYNNGIREVLVGPSGSGAEQTFMAPGQMYKIPTMNDNIALIIPK